MEKLTSGKNTEEQPQLKPTDSRTEGINVTNKMNSQGKANGFGPKRSMITL